MPHSFMVKRQNDREEIMTIEQIKEQLKTIRLYYADKTGFEEAFSVLPHKVITLAKEYAEIISNAPLDLYLVYFYLYVKGLTQEAAAEEMNYSSEYVRQKNKSLLLQLYQSVREMFERMNNQEWLKALNQME